MKPPLQRTLIGALLLAMLFAGAPLLFAQGETDDAIQNLATEIENKKANIDHLNRKIEQYKKEINAKQKVEASLRNALDLLDNRAAKTALDIEAAQEQIDLVNTEIRVLDLEIQKLEMQLVKDRGLLRRVVQQIDVSDSSMRLEMIFSSRSFSDLFTQMQYLESVQNELAQTLARAKEAKNSVTQSRLTQETKRESLSELFADLSRKKDLLEQESGTKSVLLGSVQNSEAQFQTLLRDLREEQAFINSQVLDLQLKLGDRIDESDALGGGNVLSWPVNKNYKGISTLFHDPTYPYRHLFEHSGLDIPQKQGSPLHVAAPGYVAWTRTGRLYGNYIMVIHSNGIATLYAHLSRIDVKPDQFVKRGEIIGATGGMPGTKGAGLSTGPHLHFETRKDGVPVDPMRYLLK